MSTSLNPSSNRDAYQGSHILAQDYQFETDTWKSGLNNDVLLFGPSGAGKTRYYVKPNILNSHESMIISDTKGSLYRELGPQLENKGFKVCCIDFTDLTSSEGYGYNPLDAIRFNDATHSYKDQDIQTLCECLVKVESPKDPFWDHAARQYLKVLITYELESNYLENSLDEGIANIQKLYPTLGTKAFEVLMEELDEMVPDNHTRERYNAIKPNFNADKMHSSIQGILSSHLDPLVFSEALALYRKPERISFPSLG